jgi:hypothetical protein
MSALEMAEQGIWANHCMSLIIARKARETAEFMEKELKKALALLPELEATEDREPWRKP